MTNKEAESILFEGMYQTDNSIVEYYKNIAKEKGYSLKVFFDELYNVYMRIEKYVNSYEVTEDIYLDENGNEFKNKNVIRLPLTEQPNFEKIDSDNVGYLCRGFKEIIEELLITEVINILPKLKKPATSSDSQISIPLLALKYYYLEQSKSIVKTKEAFLADNKRSKSINNFRNIYYAIGKETEIDPLKQSYLKRVIPLLEIYPRAKQKAEDDLYSFSKGVTKR